MAPKLRRHTVLFTNAILPPTTGAGSFRRVLGGCPSDKAPSSSEQRHAGTDGTSILRRPSDPRFEHPTVVSQGRLDQRIRDSSKGHLGTTVPGRSGLPSMRT